jgi:SAM-dependent methyltransferase
MSVRDDENCWSYWYPAKTGLVEPELPKLEELLATKRGNQAPRLLDVGCGNGRNLIYFARRGYRVFGFDRSHQAIEYATLDLKEENLKGNLLVHDMTQNFPYEDLFFDAVMSTRVIGHAYSEQVRKISKEIDRVLAHGGYLYLQVPLHEREIKNIEEFGRRVEFVDSMTHIPLEGNEKLIPHHHFTLEHLEELFPNYQAVEFHQSTDHYNGICLIGEKN